MKHSAKHARGMTLIELVITIVVVGICIVGALGLLASLSMRSAATMTRTQAAAIASAYLEDVLSHSFTEVEAYPGRIDAGARDANGAMIAGLGQYRVEIINTPVTLGVAPRTANARQVEIVVTDPNGRTTMLTGYSVDQAGQVLY